MREDRSIVELIKPFRHIYIELGGRFVGSLQSSLLQQLVHHVLIKCLLLQLRKLHSHGHVASLYRNRMQWKIIYLCRTKKLMFLVGELLTGRADRM